MATAKYFLPTTELERQEAAFMTHVASCRTQTRLFGIREDLMN